jgi:hypothetical protein
MPWADAVKRSMKKCFNHCSPRPSNYVNESVVAWSFDMNLRHEALEKVLSKMPMFENMAQTYKSNGGQQGKEDFIRCYGGVAYEAINEARTNYTRGMKRVFFSGPTTGINPSDTSLTRFGKYQIAMGCLQNDKHIEVTGQNGNLLRSLLRCMLCMSCLCVFCLVYQVTVNPRLGEDMTVLALSAILNGRLRTNDAVFKMVTDGYKIGGVPTMTDQDTVTLKETFTSICSVRHEAMMLQVGFVRGLLMCMLIHLSATFFVLLRTGGSWQGV